jgi:hypothetical protein
MWQQAEGKGQAPAGAEAGTRADTIGGRTLAAGDGRTHVLDEQSARQLAELLRKYPKELAVLRRLVEGQPPGPAQRDTAPVCPGSPLPAEGPGVPLAAVMMGDPATHRFTIHYAPAGQPARPPAGPPTEPAAAARSDAAKLFELLHALDPSYRWRKASPMKVFLLRFVENCSFWQIGYKCHCSKALVARRLKQIHSKVSWTPQRLGELAGYVEAIEDALSDPRARRIYRKGAVYGEEQDTKDSD